jgi:hypothetical protein
MCVAYLEEEAGALTAHQLKRCSSCPRELEEGCLGTVQRYVRLVKDAVMQLGIHNFVIVQCDLSIFVFGRRIRKNWEGFEAHASRSI